MSRVDELIKDLRSRVSTQTKYNDAVNDLSRLYPGELDYSELAVKNKSEIDELKHELDQMQLNCSHPQGDQTYLATGHNDDYYECNLCLLNYKM